MAAGGQLFFSFDGIDGAGKSTQLQRFSRWLEDQGHDVTCCRDPGTTSLGEQIRQVLLGDHEVPISPTSEMLLYMAARAQLVEEFIRPALDAGKVVIADRYLLANVVYQGHAGGLDVQALWQVGRIATGDLEPACTFVLDMDPERAKQRRQRAADRMERRDADYFQRVRRGFLTEAQRHPDRIFVINADQEMDQVHREIIAVAQGVLS